MSDSDIFLAYGGRPPWRSFTISFRVRMMGLLFGLHQLHERLPHHFARRLLHVFESTGIKLLDLGLVSDHQLLCLLRWNRNRGVIVGMFSILSRVTSPFLPRARRHLFVRILRPCFSMTAAVRRSTAFPIMSTVHINLTVHAILTISWRPLNQLCSQRKDVFGCSSPVEYVSLVALRTARRKFEWNWSVKKR